MYPPRSRTDRPTVIITKSAVGANISSNLRCSDFGTDLFIHLCYAGCFANQRGAMQDAVESPTAARWHCVDAVEGAGGGEGEGVNRGCQAKKAGCASGDPYLNLLAIQNLHCDDVTRHQMPGGNRAQHRGRLERPVGNIFLPFITLPTLWTLHHDLPPFLSASATVSMCTESSHCGGRVARAARDAVSGGGDRR